MNLKKTAASLAAVIFIMVVSAAAAAAATLTVGNATSGSCAHVFTTIQSAVTAASAGDTIQVCPGTYNELVAVVKTLTIAGAKAGLDARTRATTNESIVGTGDGAFQIQANKVVIDGFTIQGVTNDPNVFPTGLGAGIWTNPGFSGTNGGHQIRNNIIQNNIIGIELDNDGTYQTRVERNLIQNNNASGPLGGTGIATDFGLSNAVIDNNKFVGHTDSGISEFSSTSGMTVSNNEFAGNARAMGLFAVTSSSINGNTIHNSSDPLGSDVRLYGGVSGLSVTCNLFTSGAGRAMRVDDAGFGGGPNSSITFNQNNISGYSIGLEEDAGGYMGGSLDATKNWWGSSTGPTIASNPGGTGALIIDQDGVVNYLPFLTSFSSCAPVPQIGPPTNKDQCKNDGWMSFTVPRKFKNQGDCIQYVNTGK